MITQLQDICELNEPVVDSTAKTPENETKSKNETSVEFNQNPAKEVSHNGKEDIDENQLICFGGGTGPDEKLDGLTLDDLNGTK